MDKEKYNPAVYDHQKTLANELGDPEFREAYESLEDEFALLEVFLQARKSAHKTQDELAKIMHTSRSTIARIEACGNAQHHSPSVGTLRRYAKALGYKLKIELEPVSTN